jgi:hypothetical protein
MFDWPLFWSMLMTRCLHNPNKYKQILMQIESFSLVDQFSHEECWQVKWFVAVLVSYRGDGNWLHRPKNFCRMILDPFQVWWKFLWDCVFKSKMFLCSPWKVSDSIASREADMLSPSPTWFDLTRFWDLCLQLNMKTLKRVNLFDGHQDKQVSRVSSLTFNLQKEALSNKD